MNRPTKKNLILPALLLTLALAARAATPTLSVTPEQMQRTGIVLDKAGPAAGAGGEVVLQGMATFPTTAVQLLSAPVDGVVEAIKAEQMQTVAAGAPVVVLRSPQLVEWQRQYIQASVQARLAHDKSARDEALFKDGIIAESRLHESRGANVQAAAALDQARQALRIAGMSDGAIAGLAKGRSMSPILTLAAPRRGIVVEQMAAIGQRVDAGTPLAKVAQQDQLWLELQATQQQGALIRPGDPVLVRGCAQPGKVSALAAQLQSASQTMTVRVTVPSAAACMRPNQHLEAVVTVHRADQAAVRVKAGALAANGGKDYVFVRDKNGFHPVEVAVQARDNQWATVRGRLRAGDEVAVQGVSTLKGMWLGFGAEGNESK